MLGSGECCKMALKNNLKMKTAILSMTKLMRPLAVAWLGKNEPNRDGPIPLIVVRGRKGCYKSSVKWGLQ